MTLTPSDRRDIIRYELEKSRLNLDQAILAKNHDYWDLVANRLYYSAFHVISALLISDKIQVKSHKGAIMMFHSSFVRSGKVPIEYGKIISFMQAKREKADYDSYTNISQEEIEPIISDCIEMIEHLSAMVKNNID